MAPLQWLQANNYGIAFDVNNETWNAGHVNDILGYSIIVASDTGGVWLINPALGAPFENRYPAQCPSNKWLDNSMSTLAFGPAGQTEVFAGTWTGPTIYALVFQTHSNTVTWTSTATITLPLAAGGIIKLLIQQTPRRIIAACANDVYWSEIPMPVNQVTGYSWHLVATLPLSAFSGLALGPGSSNICPQRRR